MNLSPIERSVLKLAKKLLKIGPINIERLYTISILNLRYDNSEISQAIYQLFSKRILVKGSKITKDTALKNQIRNKIFEYISSNPGSHFREIQRTLDLSIHQTIWHLEMLEEFGFIRKNKISNKITYFNFKINPELFKSIFMLRDVSFLRVLKNILLEPGIDLNTLAKNAKIKAEVVENITFNLQSLDLVFGALEKDTLRYFGKMEKIEPILKILKVPEVKIKKYREIETLKCINNNNIISKGDWGLITK